MNEKVYLKRNQTLISTWHGSLGIKKFGKEVYKGGRHWLKAAINTGKMSDYCISNSDFENSIYRKTFWPNTPICMFGHPRNDIFFEKYIEKRKYLKSEFCQKYSVDINTQFVLYAPTFRDNVDFDYDYLSNYEISKALNKRFGGKWSFLYRSHPRFKDKIINNNIISVNDYADFQELLCIADVLITDYSSCAFDYILTKKPVFIIAPDLESYKIERDFFYPLESTPFPIANDNDELINNIININIDKFKNECNIFLKEKGCIEDGFASERTVDLIVKIINQSY